MKLTTKIIIGIILSIFIIPILLIISFSFTDRVNSRKFNSLPDISQETMQKKEVTPYKVISLDVEPMKYFYLTGSLQIRPAKSEDERNKILLPQDLSDIFSFHTSGDTLIINMDANESFYQKYYGDEKRNERILRQLPGFNLTAYTTQSVDVVSNSGGIQIDIRDIDTDHIKVNTRSDIRMENCKSNTVEPLVVDAYNKSVHFKDCKINELNIDLDFMNNWSIGNCDTKVENLTGSRDYTEAHFRKTDANEVNWYPKNEKARLNLNLYDGAVKVVYQ